MTNTQLPCCRFLLRLLLAALSLSAGTVTQAEQARQPNIIFVLADDLGWSELGCYGNDFHETPHLDRLAKEGMRFTSAYAAAPVCSPYRAALLTGQHPARIGILDYLRPNSSNALPTDQVTLPEVLSKNGYSTGMIGKWHLTGYRYHDAEFEVTPRDHGFAWNIGREVKGVGNGANFWPYVFRDQDIRWLDLSENRLGENEYLTDRLNLEAVDFVRRKKDKPFFLYLSHYAPHTILNGRPDLVEKYRNKHAPGKCTRENCYICKDAGLTGDAEHHWAGRHNPHLAAMLESIDHGVGQLTEKLEELGLAENTIFIFTSDNGGETNVTSNAPLRGGKSQIYEGGIRVPLIVRWPGRVREGSVCKQPTANYDFYPTLLAAADVSPDPTQKLDGISTLPTWKDPTAAPDREAIFWHYPLDEPHFLGGVSAGAVRAGQWKLIEKFDDQTTSRYELYNLATDESEAHDLAANEPDRVSRLQQKLRMWRTDVGASVPSTPLLVSPRSLYFGDHFSEGQVSSRWFFQKEWAVENGILRRNEHVGENKRLFVKDPIYRDCMVRFDFRFEGASDLRLVTGSSGHYNAVIHIRPDHFFIQTAMDDRGPYFSHRHGECAFDFKQGTWHTMTVEFVGDEVVAHVDRQHLAYAKHPILAQQRTYLAFQVDNPAAAFDNFQVFKAAPHSDQAENREFIRQMFGRHPVNKSLEQQYDIQKTNAHDILFQSDQDYRALVRRVDELKEKEKREYPDVFGSVKEFRKKIDKLRKKLHAEDADYKETLFATFRAANAIESYLIGKAPAFDSLPASRRPAQLQRLRLQHQTDVEYVRLVAAQEAAQYQLESTYPELFISNEEILEQKKRRRNAAKDDPEFQKLIDETAAGWRAEQEYLHTHDPLLGELKKQLDSIKR
jgi:arylsulfatase A